MSAPQFTPGPWRFTLGSGASWNGAIIWGDETKVATITRNADKPIDQKEADARLIAAAPDHALICWAMCVQDATWEEWVPFDGTGEFCFAGLRYATRLDEFGAPTLTPALRAALAKARGEQ